MLNLSAFDKYMKPKKEKAAPAEPTPVKGSFDLNGDDICPYCQRGMRLGKVGEMTVYICEQDRAVVPAPNEVQGAAAEVMSPPQEVSMLDLHRVEQRAYRRNSLNFD